MASELAKLRRETLVAIRVVRMALSEVDGSPLVLDDPFGGKIQRKVVGDRTYYWSAGPDGLDHRGNPEKDLVFVR